MEIQDIERIAVTALLRRIRVEQYGEVSKDDLARIVLASPLELLLVRWQEGRALVPAQTVASLIAATERGGWCVRDVSLPAGR